MYNGTYYTVEGLQYKGSSVVSININELTKLVVLYRDTDLKGFISKSVKGHLGIVWDQGQWRQHKISGFPNYWTEPKNLLINKP